jgi:bacterioferritin (cytochrome b1)
MSNAKKIVARRGLLQGLAIAGAGAALAACAKPAVDPGKDYTAEIGALNALLSAEYKAIDAYTQGAGVLTAESTGGATQADKDLAGLVLAVAVEFQKDHREHATLLAATIEHLGGAPVLEKDHKFTLPMGFKASTLNVMKLAANEERRAAVAYNQVIKGLGEAEDRFIAAAIQGDETQHFVVLTALIEGLAQPTAALTAANAPKVVPHAFVASTTEQGGSSGLDQETPLATNDQA